MLSTLTSVAGANLIGLGSTALLAALNTLYHQGFFGINQPQADLGIQRQHLFQHIVNDFGLIGLRRLFKKGIDGLAAGFLYLRSNLPAALLGLLMNGLAQLENMLQLRPSLSGPMPLLTQLGLCSTNSLGNNLKSTLMSSNAEIVPTCVLFSALAPNINSNSKIKNILISPPYTILFVSQHEIQSP